MFLQFADGREAVNRVAGKSTDRLCQNKSDLPGQGILHHLIKPVPALGGGAADALVYLVTLHNTMLQIAKESESPCFAGFSGSLRCLSSLNNSLG